MILHTFTNDIDIVVQTKLTYSEQQHSCVKARLEVDSKVSWHRLSLRTNLADSTAAWYLVHRGRLCLNNGSRDGRRTLTKTAVLFHQTTNVHCVHVDVLTVRRYKHTTNPQHTLIHRTITQPNWKCGMALQYNTTKCLKNPQNDTKENKHPA